jgi:SAM-dependent methyltransferase
VTRVPAAATAYVGSELTLFAAAVHWKRYVARAIGPFIGARVLDVGAGLGSNVVYLHHAGVRDWLALEPDAAMAGEIAAAVAQGDLPATCRARAGDTRTLGAAEGFDSVLYLDVLEHIEDDRAELARAAAHLAPGGALIVLAPAHPFLYTPFDKAIGHFRRYTRASLVAAAPAGLELRRCWMLDSVGYFASLANRLLLQSAMPTARQIAVWDRLMVPPSRWLDPATGHRFGKSIVAVWTARGYSSSLSPP